MFLGALLLGAAFLASYETVYNRTAVIITEQAPLHETPTADAPSELTLHEGLLLDILRETDGWVQVRLPNGTTGWLASEALAEV